MSRPATLAPFVVVTDSASGRPWDRLTDVADEPLLRRLALWLADVAAEAELAAAAPDAIPTPGGSSPE